MPQTGSNDEKYGGRKSCWTVPLIKSIVKANTLLTFLLLKFFILVVAFYSVAHCFIFHDESCRIRTQDRSHFKFTNVSLQRVFVGCLEKVIYPPPKFFFFCPIHFDYTISPWFFVAQLAAPQKVCEMIKLQSLLMQFRFANAPPLLKSVYNLVGRETQTGFKFYIIFHNWRRIFVVVLYYNNEL